MLPSGAVLNVRNTFSRNVVILCNVFMFSLILSYFQNIRFGQFSIRRFTVSVPTFLNSILGVVGFRSKFQMFWVYARRIVALIMTNNFTRNIFSSYILKHKPVCKPKFTVKKNTTISSLISSTLPQPTVISFKNLLVQPIFRASRGFVEQIAIMRAELRGRFFTWKSFIAITARKTAVKFGCFEFAFV